MDGLLDFVSQIEKITDVFCFQEANNEFVVKAFPLLKHFTFFDTSLVTDDIDKLQINVVKGDNLRSSGNINLYKTTKLEPKGFMQYLIYDSPKFLIGNIHGKVYPGDKRDATTRISQSKTIIDFWRSQSLPTIIGGDFNLLPDTKSILMFEQNGFRNLIQEYNIKTTRNESAWNFAKNSKTRKYFGKQLYSDYVFVSPEIKVTNFEVPNIEISDHLPLILDFEI